MSWIALWDKRHALCDLNGVAHRTHKAATESHAPSGTPLPRGSMVVETRVSPYDRPQTLLGMASQTGSGFRLSLQAVPGGGVVLVLNRGGRTAHVAVNLDTGGRADVLRVTYSWDVPANVGRLAVEQPGTWRVAVRTLTRPVALTPAEIRESVQDDDARVLSSDLSYIAFSDRIEPIGPMPSLYEDTPVMTAQGYRKVGDLKRGDVVQTPSGDLVPVLANIRRTVPASGHFAPIRLRAPFFGLSRDIVTSPTQRLLIGGSRVEYMFGSEFVLVPAGHLLHGNAAENGGTAPLATYCQLLLPNHEAILAADTYVESMDVGRMRRRRDLLSASLLSGYPRRLLPEHARTAFPVLREFDALTLAAQRAA